MVLERAEFQIRSGAEADFTAIMETEGIPHLSAVPGVISVQFGRGVENPGKFMILVVWQSLEAHTAFSKSPAFAPFLAYFKPFSTSGSMEHFDMT